MTFGHLYIERLIFLINREYIDCYCYYVNHKLYNTQEFLDLLLEKLDLFLLNKIVNN